MRITALVALLTVVVAGCGHRAAKSPRTPGLSAQDAGRAVGSTVVLARQDGRTVAYVADEDTRAVLTIDVEKHEELASTPVGGTPGPMVLLPDGRLAVAITDSAQVLLLEPRPGSIPLVVGILFLETAAEPRGMTLSPDGSVLWVTTGWGHNLTGFRIADRARVLDVDLPREPRAVVASDDGRRLFVSHAVGAHASVVDVGSGAVRKVALRARSGELQSTLQLQRSPGEPDPPPLTTMPESPEARKTRLAKLAGRLERGLPTCQQFALAKAGTRILVPGVSVEPNVEEGAAPPAETYGDANSQTELESVAVLDAATATPSPASLLRDMTGVDPRRASCLLPRAAVYDARADALLVACQGSDLLVAYEAKAMAPVMRPITQVRVGSGPTGLAVDDTTRRAFVWSQFDRTLTIIALDDERYGHGTEPRAGDDGTTPTRRVATRIAMAPVATSQAPSTAVALGRQLFHAVGDSRISRDGRACASCHPDGRDDAIVWATPVGARRTISLTGRLESSGPFSWQGTSTTVRDHVTTTVKRLGGTGLDAAELEALTAYAKSLAVPGHKGRPNQEQIDQGEAIFTSPKTGCSSCHAGAAYTDGKRHDIGTGRAFDTPSLIGIGASGPYFHDARFADLNALLRGTDGRMGRTAHLRPEERDALLAFLRSL